MTSCTTDASGEESAYKVLALFFYHTQLSLLASALLQGQSTGDVLSVLFMGYGRARKTGTAGQDRALR